ncbi:TonB-dependent receptor [Methylotenera sp.]|uniref:TonB-dependent receptor n=1 Tax=Methylotenera sp. TaxID=2051956 RepID=UPI002730832B|nr:TonB-dependent receptor [Methylotenera sp.]MDP2072005.1 TonB-dependent receptor [Methylotenera sp.]MDP2230590.1 TonB-dependent receptor [Methylotenera sp.]MDP3006986.1 TonB-dependent receptor [Methylotenera sp.]MDP3007077.1 TonB-dependent receptor [Methylotenera sp.]MDP3140490.1 TonB-dependent receptor [Methylotenera sp.]
MQPNMIRSLITLLFLPGGYAVAENDRNIQLDSVVVIGQSATSIEKDLAGSVDVITRDELEYEHVSDTLELFNKTPGVALSRYNQGIINTDITIRGFAGDGLTPHAKLLIDGIPSNLHNGYNELDHLFPTGIQSIQVFKGTSDPSVGLFATAGNYRVETRKNTDKVLELTLGSFNTKELQGYVGYKTGDFTQNYSLGYRNADGYRDHTSIEKIALSGRWQYDFENTSLALSTRYGKYEADSPGYLSKQQARQYPRSSASYANQDGGEKESKQVSLHADHFFNNDLDLSVKAYWQNFERERWVRLTQAGTLQNRYDDQDMSGFIAKLNWQFDPKWRLETGFDIEKQQVIEQRFGTIGQQRVRNTASVNRNRHYNFDTKGAYMQIGHTPNKMLSWNAAIRADQIDGDYKQFNASGVATPRKIYNFGTIIQPKLNAFLNLSDHQTLFANTGRSFQHPFGADAYTAGDTNARDVSMNDGWELGLKSTFAKQLNTRISYWEQKAKDEFVVIDGTGQNVGETSRKGIDFSLSYPILDNFSVWANVSKVYTSIKKSASTSQAFEGNNLRGIPDHTASIGSTYNWSSDLVMRLHVDRQGAYHINEANIGGKYGAYTLVNASADYKTRWGKVIMQVNNLFDKHYEYVYDQSTNANIVDSIHSPGAGRNFSISTRVDF